MIGKRGPNTRSSTGNAPGESQNQSLPPSKRKKAQSSNKVIVKSPFVDVNETSNTSNNVQTDENKAEEEQLQTDSSPDISSEHYQKNEKAEQQGGFNQSDKAIVIQQNQNDHVVSDKPLKQTLGDRISPLAHVVVDKAGEQDQVEAGTDDEDAMTVNSTKSSSLSSTSCSSQAGSIKKAKLRNWIYTDGIFREHGIMFVSSEGVSELDKAIQKEFQVEGKQLQNVKGSLSKIRTEEIRKAAKVLGELLRPGMSSLELYISWS